MRFEFSRFAACSGLVSSVLLAFQPAHVAAQDETPCRSSSLTDAEDSRLLPRRRCGAIEARVYGGPAHVLGDDEQPDWGIRGAGAVTYRFELPILVSVGTYDGADVYFGARPRRHGLLSYLVAGLDLRELEVSIGPGVALGGSSTTPVQRYGILGRVRAGAADGFSLTVTWGLFSERDGDLFPLTVGGPIEVRAQLPFRTREVGKQGFMLQVIYSDFVAPGLSILAKHRVWGHWGEASVYLVYGYSGTVAIVSDGFFLAHGPMLGVEWRSGCLAASGFRRTPS